MGWRTEGRRDPDRREIAHAEFLDDSVPGAEIVVDFSIPAEGPVFYNGKVLRIIWEVRVTPPGTRPELLAIETFRVTPRKVRA